MSLRSFFFLFFFLGSYNGNGIRFHSSRPWISRFIDVSLMSSIYFLSVISPYARFVTFYHIDHLKLSLHVHHVPFSSVPVKNSCRVLTATAPFTERSSAAYYWIGRIVARLCGKWLTRRERDRDKESDVGFLLRSACPHETSGDTAVCVSISDGSQIFVGRHYIGSYCSMAVASCLPGDWAFSRTSRTF